MNEKCADLGGQEQAGEKQFPLFFSAFVVSESVVLLICTILEKLCEVLSSLITVI